MTHALIAKMGSDRKYTVTFLRTYIGIAATLVAVRTHMHMCICVYMHGYSSYDGSAIIVSGICSEV